MSIFGKDHTEPASDPVTEQPKASTLPHDQETVVEIDPVTTTDHRPGSPLETKADAEANAEFRAEQEAYVDARPEPTPLYVAAHDPVANYLSRDNIVADGPGTVADFIAAQPVSDSE